MTGIVKCENFNIYLLIHRCNFTLKLKVMKTFFAFFFTFIAFDSFSQPIDFAPFFGKANRSLYISSVRKYVEDCPIDETNDIVIDGDET